MYCSNCGIQLPDNLNFCNKCGFRINNINVSYQNSNQRTYLNDVNFHNSSEKVGNLLSQGNRMRTIGLILLLPSVFGNLFLAPIFPFIFIITMPAVIISFVFNIKALKCYLQMKKLYLVYTEQYYTNK